jgi:hypothetical protein
MHRPLAANLDLAVVFRFVVISTALFSSVRDRHGGVYRNAILLPLVSWNRASVECVETALAAYEARPWCGRATAIDVELFPRDALLPPVRRHCHPSNLSWIDISEEFLICPSSSAAWRKSVVLNIAVSLFVGSTRAALVNALGHRDILSARSVSFVVAVVLFVLAW